jgi:hypothetical protein
MDMKTMMRGCLCVLLVVLAGCATMGESLMSTRSMEGPYGWISPWGMPVSDGHNSKNIEFGHLDANMNYYYSDSPILPAAVIEISKDYAMDDIYWKRITDPQMLIEVVQAIKVRDRTNGARDFRSFTVKAPDTRPIGTWYSNRYVYGMKLKLAADKKLSLYVPNFMDTRTYYVKKGKDNLLSQGMAASERQTSY